MNKNHISLLALQYVHTTKRHIFLTGKAGTGKTTLLREIIQTTFKNCVVAAPTGIAAINAGGVTLHSLFQLPFGSFIPDERFYAEISFDQQFNTPRTISSSLRMHETKRKIIKEMELLIIDEVSMLRADLLDEIDHVLRLIRRKRTTPFGGVQVMFIGDLYQLPPVISNQEWGFLKNYYPSPYFFDSHVMREADMLTIELDQVYRQHDQHFIDLLNRMRNNELSDHDINRLNAQVKADLQVEKENGYIHITTHNRKADQINTAELNKLPGVSFEFNAKISGKFETNNFPMPESLVLKKNAQVMFVKNDPSGNGEYFNGKLGRITTLTNDEIRVTSEDGVEVKVTKYNWENKRYKLNENNSKIEEELIGNFSQYPIKLAWAITVHKSQGLTFEKAILDLSDSFAPGQMYVALSRLTSLQGLALSSPIPHRNLEIDAAVGVFGKEKQSLEKLESEIFKDQKGFYLDCIENAFSFSPILTAISFMQQGNKELTEELPLTDTDRTGLSGVIIQLNNCKETADKFIREIYKKIEQYPQTYENVLTERLEKAKDYFFSQLDEIKVKLIAMRTTVEKDKKRKTFTKNLSQLVDQIQKQKTLIYRAYVILEAATRKSIPNKEGWYLNQPIFAPKHVKVSKEEKKPTKEISFELFQSGKTIDAIAKERSLAITTIEGHLSHYVSTGEIDVAKFCEMPKVENIIKVIKVIDDTAMSAIKEKLGEEYTYSDIRFGVAYFNFLKSFE